MALCSVKGEFSLAVLIFNSSFWGCRRAREGIIEDKGRKIEERKVTVYPGLMSPQNMRE